MNTPPRFRPELPPDFVRRVLDVHRQRGRTWLDSLPLLLAECADRWSLTLGPQASQLSYSLVVDARLADGTPAVLKLGMPGPEFSAEAAALRFFDGRGAVRLIDADGERGVLLIEKAEPGTPIWNVDDEQAVPIAVSIMRQLWRPVREGTAPAFPTLVEWVGGFDRLRSRNEGTTGPLPPRMVDKAERLFQELGTASEPVLLHGDLHHGNIVSARRAPWLAIDPKGVIGAREFELGAFMKNPLEAIISDRNPPRKLTRRIALFSELLGFPRKVVRDWAFIQAMLSLLWTVEDHGRQWERPLQYVRYLDELKV